MSESNSSNMLIAAVIAVPVVSAGLYFALSGDEKPESVNQPIVEEIKPITPPTLAKLPEKVNKEPEMPVVVLDNQDDMSDDEVEELKKPEQPKLPSLNNSDSLVKQDLADSYQSSSLIDLLVPEDVIRKFVVFSENAAQGDLIQRHSPVLKPSQAFKAIPINDKEYIIDPTTYQRYDKYVDLVTELSTETILDYLDKFEPLLTEAYQEIGYESADIKVTISDTITHILQTPVIRNDIKLVAPSAMYKFADDDLESLNPIQKFMLRLGPDNLEKLQASLKPLKSKLDE
ncbi:DUF3014 domain-containing protein [Catenovulum maritimum]|uniref:DUF3014 domain-containing protein n=1 Tax=Catenovulum maritimum TaxID=1513271 RepID=A0A0J8JP82_9ALTE|nr:DUF3014 domain-containing protein [Catenovulum maritimum]KMT66456.1 hypothetical protein XM47_02620 [Catenovulum maritimum]